MAKNSRNVAKPAIGVVGALAAIASVWWFAFRPRHRDEAVTVDDDQDAAA